MVKVRKPEQKSKPASVRVLPALIAVATGALAFKAVDVARAIAAPVENEVQEEKPESPLTAKPGEEHKEEGAEEAPPGATAATADGKADICLPSIDYAAETGISGQELLVLRSLSQRREQLEQRAAELDTREQVAVAAEARVNTQIADLKSVQAAMQVLADKMESKRTEQLNALVKTYETMKATESARIFNAMDDSQLLELAKAMKPAVLADVMSKMETKRAVQLTRMISDLSKPPANVDALKQTAG